MRRQGRVVRERDRDLLGIGDDVVVCHDQSGGINDEAGPEGCNRRPEPVWSAKTVLVAKEIPKKLVELRSCVRRLRLAGLAGRGAGCLGGRDVDDHFDKVCGELSEQLGEWCPFNL